LQKSIKDKEKHTELLDYAASLLKEMTVVEETLYQTKSKSGQDPLNFPIRLNNKLAHLNSLTRIFDNLDMACDFFGPNPHGRTILYIVSNLIILFPCFVNRDNVSAIGLPSGCSAPSFS
jgi:hypothetical protein